MKHKPFSVLIIGSHPVVATPVLKNYLSGTPATVEITENLPGELSGYEVLVLLDPFSMEEWDLHRVGKFVDAGGGCLGILTEIHKNDRAGALFGAEAEQAGPHCETRILFNDREHPLSARLPDSFYVSGNFLPLTIRSDEVETLLYADWRYAHQTVFTIRHHGKGIFALTSLVDFDEPALLRILYRLLRQLAGFENPHKRLGVGLLGYPLSVGELHATAADRGVPGLELRAICDLNPGRLKAARECFQADDLIFTQDSGELQDPDIDIVIISTPPNSHARLAGEMYAYGKHVVVEKPLAMSVAEAEAMLANAGENNLLLCCHQNRRWDADYLAIQQAMKDGLIGDLFYMETFVGGYAHPCNYWHSEMSVSGGTSYDWGAHYLDWMLALMPGTISEVRSTRHKRVWVDITNADQERIQIRFSDGREAEFTHSDVAFIPKPKWYLVGTEGTIVGDWRELTTYEIDPVTYYKAHPIPSAELGATLRVRRKQGRNQIVEQNLPLMAKERFPFHENLTDHLLLGEPLLVPPEHSARVVAVLEAAKRSADSGYCLEHVNI